MMMTLLGDGAIGSNTVDGSLSSPLLPIVSSSSDPHHSSSSPSIDRSSVVTPPPHHRDRRKSSIIIRAGDVVPILVSPSKLYTPQTPVSAFIADPATPLFPNLTAAALPPTDGASIVSGDDGVEEAYPLSPVRWWALFIYCYLAFTQSFIWITFSPINDATVAYYHTDTTQVDLLLNWGTILFVAFTPVVMYYSSTPSGLRRMIISSAWLIFIAVLLRMFPLWLGWCGPNIGGNVATKQKVTLVILHIAQILNAIAGPAINITVSKFACIWFGAEERMSATALTLVMNNTGTAIGMLIGPYVVPNPDNIPRYLYIQLAVGTIAFICTMSHYPERPVHHPSLAARTMFTAESQPLIASLMQSLSIADFRWFALAYGLLTCMLNCWSSILSTVLPSDVYDVGTIGWLSFGVTTSGIVSGLVHGRVVYHPFFRRRIRTLIFALASCAIVAAFFVVASLPSVISSNPLVAQDRAQVIVGITCMGWFIGGTFPLAFELSAELTYPLPESISGGVLGMSGNFVGLLFLFAAPLFSGAVMNATLIIGLIIAAAILPMVTENYKRHDAEQEDEKRRIGKIQQDGGEAKEFEKSSEGWIL